MQKKKSLLIDDMKQWKSGKSPGKEKVPTQLVYVCM